MSSKICQTCHPIFRHNLIQTGWAHPKSYKCSVCSAIHDDNGELYDPNKTYVINKLEQTNKICPNCGSINIQKIAFSKYYICSNCKHKWTI